MDRLEWSFKQAQNSWDQRMPDEDDGYRPDDEYDPCDDCDATSCDGCEYKEIK